MAANLQHKKQQLDLRKLLVSHFRTSKSKSSYCPPNFECMGWSSPYLLQSNALTALNRAHEETDADGMMCPAGGCGERQARGPEVCWDHWGSCNPGDAWGNCT